MVIANMKENVLHFGEIKPFEFKISYVNIDRDSPLNEHDSHSHEGCEIYINLSGDVSFAVENRIYPIKPGDIIITRPYEYHHCIYHSDKKHKHFWILFSSLGNEDMLDIFFDPKLGSPSHLTLSPGDTEKLVSLCHTMVEAPKDDKHRYYNFFKLITLLQNAEITETGERQYPSDIISALNYIGSNFTQPITVTAIAKSSNVSVNTLERHFMQIFGQTPTTYIRKKRLSNAAKLLTEGKTVTEASEESGFSDYSNFISLFRKAYGITPLQYKKQQRKL